MPRKIIFSKEQTEKIISLYKDDGLSCYDISKQFRVAKNTIRALLIDFGVSLNNKLKIISRKAKGRVSPAKGAIRTVEARAKMGAAKKGNKYCVGRKCSPETREKQRISAIARAPFTRRGKTVSKMSDQDRKERECLRSLYKRLVRRVLKKSGKRKEIPSEKYLGYSQKDLMTHLGPRPEGHELDHIIPIAEFFRRGITDPKTINALHNLQWLPRQENRTKSDNVPEGLHA